MSNEQQPQTGTSEPPAKLGGLLDRIEWLGNKLPDPAFLFLIGAAIVMVASHFAAPRLPDGWRVEWDQVGNAAGGVDEQLAVIRRVKTDAAGDPIFPPLIGSDGLPVMAEDGSPVFNTAADPLKESASFQLVETQAGPEAHLIVQETGQAVTDSGGEPIDFSERGWAVFTKTVVSVEDPATGETTQVLKNTGKITFAHSLLTTEGLYWCLKSMENNFLGFAPLGVVLLGMLGIGVAEKTGLIAALIKLFMRNVSASLLTPSMVFIGIMSSLATDAGYVVLPPLAAAIYLAAGRSPLAGIAACFAGVAAGFNANLLITSLEPLMAELTQDAARLADPSRSVSATANWYFLAASTFLITFVGWAVTALFVEKRLSKKPADEGGPDAAAAAIAAKDIGKLESNEVRGLKLAMSVAVLLVGFFATLHFWPGSPLNGLDGIFPRWVAVVVPLMFFVFVIPGIVYGWVVGNVQSTKDIAKHMTDSMAGMAPIIVLAFFAGQFVTYFGETNLGAMLAFTGGEWLFEQGMPTALLLIAFILLTVIFNLFVGSMSAKYTLFAPIFVPMFMLIGIRPELTQVAYRIGDSVSNVITPLNAYLVIVLVFMQRFAPKAGMGTLIAMMLPYTIVFGIVWTIFLLVWDALGLPLGVGDPLTAMAPSPAGALPGN